MPSAPHIGYTSVVWPRNSCRFVSVSWLTFRVLTSWIQMSSARLPRYPFLQCEPILKATMRRPASSFRLLASIASGSGSPPSTETLQSGLPTVESPRCAAKITQAIRRPEHRIVHGVERDLPQFAAARRATNTSSFPMRLLAIIFPSGENRRERVAADVRGRRRRLAPVGVRDPDVAVQENARRPFAGDSANLIGSLDASRGGGQHDENRERDVDGKTERAHSGLLGETVGERRRLEVWIISQAAAIIRHMQRVLTVVGLAVIIAVAGPVVAQRRPDRPVQTRHSPGPSCSSRPTGWPRI